MTNKLNCNARDELVEKLKNWETADRKLIAATVYCCRTSRVVGESEKHEARGPFTLCCDYTKEELENFLASINFNYNNSYGTQYLQGTLWFSDGTWADRREYDGSEWWEHNERPPLPTK